LKKMALQYNFSYIATPFFSNFFNFKK